MRCQQWPIILGASEHAAHLEVKIEVKRGTRMRN
jgi:hypothetical protein